MFINFAKTQRGKDSEDEFDPDEEFEGSENGDNYYEEKKSDSRDSVTISTVEHQLRISMPEERMATDNPTFESIKNHFNSLKKSRHSRKTSSAKSVNRNQSLRSKKSRKSSQRSRSSSKRASVSEGGFTNLAYEIEFKNSDAYDLPIPETSSNLTNSFNEEGEIFSRC